MFKVLIQVDMLIPAMDQAEENSALLSSKVQSQLMLDHEEKLNTFPGSHRLHLRWDYARFGSKI